MDFEESDAINRAIRRIGINHRSRAAAALGEIGLHLGQEVLLLELDTYGERTQVQLAAALDCKPPNVTLTVRKLEGEGLISRRPSTQDGRATIVELTDEGRALIPRLKEVWRHLAEDTVSGVKRTSLARLQEVLDDLANSLSSSGTPGSREN